MFTFTFRLDSPLVYFWENSQISAINNPYLHQNRLINSLWQTQQDPEWHMIVTVPEKGKLRPEYPPALFQLAVYSFLLDLKFFQIECWLEWMFCYINNPRMNCFDVHVWSSGAKLLSFCAYASKQLNRYDIYLKWQNT